MSGASYYDILFGHASRSFKERVGVIQPRQRGNEAPLDEPGM